MERGVWAGDYGDLEERGLMGLLCWMLLWKKEREGREWGFYRSLRAGIWVFDGGDKGREGVFMLRKGGGEFQRGE